jgi:hypothetical protein
MNGALKHITLTNWVKCSKSSLRGNETVGCLMSSRMAKSTWKKCCGNFLSKKFVAHKIIYFRFATDLQSPFDLAEREIMMAIETKLFGNFRNNFYFVLPPVSRK